MQTANNRTPLRRLSLIVTVALAIGAGTLLISVAAEKISHSGLKKMIESAKTPADHRVLAAHYNAEAAAANVKAKEHEQMALWYQKAGEGAKKTPNAPGTIEHCNNLVKNYKAAADDYAALAKAHESMASEVK